MTDWGPYEVHPLADIFPLVEGEEFEKLVADIDKRGLQHPIRLSPDRSTIIDGRNRYRACMAARVDPTFSTIPQAWTEEQILDYIVSENIARRHLTPGQRSLLGVEIDAYYVELAKKRETERKLAAPSNQFTTKGSATPADLRESQNRHQRESSERAAQAVGASGRGVQQAKAVMRSAPDLADQVRAGNLALDNAYRQARARERAMPKPEAVKPARTMLTLRTHEGTPVMYPQPQGKAQFNATPGEGISWADWSWNPVTGCQHGCDYCYARELATSERYRAAYPVGFTPLFHHERLDAPANTPLPANATDAQRRVFVCSMADLYGRWVPQEWIDQVHAAEQAAPQWQYIHLTKFPDRYVGLDLPPSAWIGTSVDEQKRVRIAERAFAQISDVAVKWLSLEPLREPLQFTDLSMFEWVVIGAQTETRQPTGVVPAFAPPFEWVARIVAQAREAGCKVHLKPNLLGRTGPQSPGMQLPNEYPGGTS